MEIYKILMIAKELELELEPAEKSVQRIIDIFKQNAKASAILISHVFLLIELSHELSSEIASRLTL